MKIHLRQQRATRCQFEVIVGESSYNVIYDLNTGNVDANPMPHEHVYEDIVNEVTDWVYRNLVTT